MVSEAALRGVPWRGWSALAQGTPAEAGRRPSAGWRGWRPGTGGEDGEPGLCGDRQGGAVAILDGRLGEPAAAVSVFGAPEAEARADGGEG